MSYFYADGLDKAGNRLLTSYGKQAQAQKYRAGATISEGEKFLEIMEDGSAKLTSADNGLLCRTLMVRPAGSEDEMSGNFVVWARVNGNWQETSFRYSTYAKANAAVKSALINLYPACAVIQEDKAKTSVKNQPVINEGAPF